MDDSARIRHLHRRFGLGISRSERAQGVKLGPSGVRDRLLDLRGKDKFPISPWEFCHDEGTDETYLDPFRTAIWWSLRMLLSERPAEEKLTLFWHDHFAVGADKVEFGPAMLGYLKAIRGHAAGSFGSLLASVAQTAAMARYLDLDQSFRGQPNENFARELLELFTVGPGVYGEADVQETARAMTGYGVRLLVFEAGGENVQERAKDCIARDLPMVAFAFSPDLHDDTPKTILGESQNWDVHSLLPRLAKHPATAQRIAARLWERYGSPEPNAKVQDRLAEVFRSSDGNIGAVLREISEIDEFWKAERALVKSPMDFVVPILRQFELNPIIRTLHGNPKSPTTPAPKPLRDTAGLVFGTMAKMGLTPLFPPNVGGWEWGQAWITPNNMTARIGFADLIFGVNQPEQPLAAYLAAGIVSRKPANEREVVADFLETFDAELPNEKEKLLVEAFRANGGGESLASAATASKSLAAIGRLLFATPEFQRM
jgi:uncharacterized protein (DUF1800 family)